VFLSGMDMFICDNFFNRPLDVAYVIDPCRGDRACFQWTGTQRERVRRTRGFYVMASRYREAELQYFVAQLQAGENPMPSDPRHGNFPGMMAPVVNVSQPPPPSPYQGLALLGMLSIQACLLMLIAWRMLAAPSHIDDLTKAVVSMKKEHDAEAEEAARRQVLSQVLSEIKGEKVDVDAEVAREAARAKLEKELNVQKVASEKLLADRSDLKNLTESLEKDIATLKEDKKKLRDDRDAKLAELKKYQAAEDKEKGETAAGGWTWYWIGGVVGVLVVLAGIAAVLMYRAEDDRIDGPPPPGPMFEPTSPADIALPRTPEN
jgi:hypothetical protein